MDKKPYKNDVAVLIRFFCTDQKLQKVFDSVKEARPSRLYLYQDGARGGNDSDVEGIKRCREIVDDKNIDWECEVHRFYCDHNNGCDPSGYLSRKFLFEHETKGIILEDDTVPSQSFYRYCSELLDLYENDEKISLICGMNNIDVSNHIKESYSFTKYGGIWGWATWKRCFDKWDTSYSWLDDKKKLEIIRGQISKESYDSFISTAKWHRDTGKEYFETLYYAAQLLENGFAIVPKYNLISNIGIDNETTHGVSDVRLLPRNVQKLLFKKAYEIDFPLVHPGSVERDYIYEKKRSVSKLEKKLQRIESYVRYLIFKGPKATLERLTNKMSKRKAKQ